MSRPRCGDEYEAHDPGGCPGCDLRPVVLLCSFHGCGKDASHIQVTTSPGRVQRTPICAAHGPKPERRVGVLRGVIVGVAFKTVWEPVTEGGGRR